MFRDFFQEELEYLRELGRAMAREYPDLEPFLAAPEGDAAIERILEGTAFLAAGLRRKLDDDLPEFTHPVLESLAPQLMRPGPAMSILQFEPVGQMVTEPHVVRAGTEVDSEEVEGVSCRFRTAWPVTLLPLRLGGARVEGDVGATPTLVLELALAPGTKAEDLAIDRLRLHLGGERETRSALYFFLSEAVSEVNLRVPGQPQRGRRLPPDCVQTAGFEAGEGLWPDPPGLPLAYRLVQEYFAFRDKFHFVDVRDVGSLSALGESREFELAIRFGLPRVPALAAGPGDFRLYCTPIVNLFTRKSEALPLGSARSEYRIQPVDAEREHVEVYSVERIEGWTRGAVERMEYPRYDSIRQAAGSADGAAFFRTRTETSVVERRVDTWVSFVDAGQQRATPAADTAVAELLCTQGDLPAQLGVGDVSRATVTSPPVARFRNVSPVTAGAVPPIDAELPWRLLAQFSLNRHVLADAEALRWVFSSFDLRGLRDRQAARATQRLLDGIVSVAAHVEDVFHAGVPARGSRIDVELDAECFDGPGEMALFTRVLGELLPLYATENATVRLVVRVVPTGERWERPARRGTQPIL